MTPALRRVAATAAAVVSSTVLLVPFTAAPASAATPVEKAFVVEDRDMDGSSGLYVKSTPVTAAAGTVVVAEKAGVDVRYLSVSGDGQRAIFVLDTYNTSTYAYLRHKVVVADISGRTVRVLEDSAQDGVHYSSAPALSPDGNVAVWEVANDPLNTFAIRKADVGSGGVVALAPSLSPYAFLDQNTLLVQDAAGHAFTMPATGGTKTSVAGIPLEALNAAVSPTGTQIVWSLYDNTVPDGSPYKAAIQVAPLTFADGVATVGAATTIATGLYNRQPAFSRDGSKVYFVRNDGKANTSQGYSGPGDIWSASSAASDTSTAAVALATAAIDEHDVAIGTTDDGTAPADPVTAAATMTGTSATIRWTVPSPDADISGVLVSRAGGPSKYIPWPQTSFVDTGLVPGVTSEYGFTTVDRSGHLSSQVFRRVTAVAAGALFGDPTSAGSTSSSFPVKFATAAPGNVTFTVDYLVIGSNGYRPWVTSTAGTTRTFGSAATTGVAGTWSPPGRNYVFRVRAFDAYGNSTPAVTSGRATVPVDQTSAAFSGGVTMGSSSYYGTTARRLASTTNWARIALTGNRLQIIGVRCATCGQFAVYDGSTKIATVDTRYSRTVPRQVLYTKLTTLGKHTYTIRPLATAGRPNVILDAFAMRQ
jgi:hypothetical protein